MHLWTLLSVIVAVFLFALAQDYDNTDSLMAALDAVNRRQRDLANADANINYYGLSPYRDNGEEVIYLNPERDLNDDGQPENIGYGFQKTLGNKVPHTQYEHQPDLEEMTEAANDKVLEKLAIEYLENEFQNDNDANQYYHVGDEAKRSAFRERQFPDHYASVSGKFSEGAKKRSEFGPTAFRERSHNGEDEEETRRQLMQTMGRRMERERMMEEAEEEEYPPVQPHFENSRFPHPNGLDLDSLTENEVEEILDYLGEGGLDGDDSKLEKRYNGGTGYNFFNHGAAMGGGFGFKKRSKQRLEETEGPDNAFLYSLKYVSPEYNREAVEQLRENDAIDLSGENDEDVVRLGMKAMSDAERQARERAHWFAATQDDEEESPNSLPHEGHKKSAGLEYHMPHELASPMHHMQKKYPYDQILFKKKRVMIAKRSPDFYTSPPALHRHTGVEVRRKKKDASEPHSTDPQVASELSHIFSPPGQENTIKIVPQIIGNHVVTKQKVMTTPPPPATSPKQNTTNIEVTVVVNQYMKKNDTSNEDEGNDEEIELPVTMSRLEIPIEVKKKSIDWSDYFGLDRRRKKTGSVSANEVSRNRMTDDDSHMFNQYYKSGIAKKSSLFRGNKNDGNVLYKKSIHVVAQPFDTRIYDAERGTAAKKGGSDFEEARAVDNMDSKLRNIEDLIVNEAVKYTGAHEGTTDTKEIQEVKDKVMSRLAAAYNLEKMRRALGEFKSSLAAQKMSKYNPEHRASSKEDDSDESVKKRVAFKKDKADVENEKAELKNDVEKKDFTIGMPEENQGVGGESMSDSMSEGYMGGTPPRVYVQNSEEEECPILKNVVRHCHGIETHAGDNSMQFLPLCTLHQICYICGSDGGPSGASCDSTFLSRANEICKGDIHCEKRALRTLMGANRHRVDDIPDMGSQCWEKFCEEPLPNYQPAWSHS